MPKITLEELFANAPRFRAHEGIINARYYIKDPKDPSSPGLWFADREQRLEIARQRSYRYDATNRDTARADYDFIMVDVRPGDAVVDAHIYFDGCRQGWNGNLRNSDLSRGMYAYERKNGALIRRHIPKDIFHRTYELDEVRNFYCTKPYQKKFIEEYLMVEMQNGLMEQVPAGCEVFLNGQRLVVGSPSITPGGDVRLICGQPISFYIDELSLLQNSNSADGVFPAQALTTMKGDEGIGLSMSVYRGRESRNPYASLLGFYNEVAAAFSKADCPKLSPEQQRELDFHVRDIRARYAYFEVEP